MKAQAPVTERALGEHDTVAIATEDRVRSAGIVGLGIALPETKVTSAEIGERLGISSEWIERRTGIRERRRVKPGERVSDLAVRAARAALGDAGVEASAIDLVLVATLAADEFTPGAAPVVAAELGAANAAAIDIGAACAGSLAALALATSWLEARHADTALVIGAEVLSRFIDIDDRRTAPLFGDGAGALVLSVEGDGHVGPFLLESDGSARDAIRLPRTTGVLEMDGHETFLRAVEHLSVSTVEIVRRADLTLDEIDLFVFHQANSRILKAVGERLAVADGRVFECISELGNTSAASLPLALSAAVDRGALRPGACVVLGAIGAGLSWGTAVVRWSVR